MPASEPNSPSSPEVTAEKRDMARPAGWVHRGQSAPSEPIAWSLSNLYLQVSHTYSCMGMAKPESTEGMTLQQRNGR